MAQEILIDVLSFISEVAHDSVCEEEKAEDQVEYDQNGRVGNVSVLSQVDDDLQDELERYLDTGEQYDECVERVVRFDFAEEGCGFFAFTLVYFGNHQREHDFVVESERKGTS